MSSYYETEIDRERCILVGIIHSGESEWTTRDHLFELAQLAHTAGAVPKGQIVQEKKRIDPAYFIGRGKAKELAALLKEKNCQLAVFDDDLTPAQIKNLERLTEVKIIDRSGLILDIFAKHARTRESRTQVELAQLNYLLPRLTRQWSHLSRQVGGIGTKGPGETQLETDRRLIRTRISHLREDLKRIEKQRRTQRKKRSEIFKAALVGYTNVGKSTIMRHLTGADVLVENQLFATLDATIRRFKLGSGLEILISDTVGFIRKLPPHLVASFKSTLEEVRETDMIIHVVDISSPNFRDHIITVEKILKDLEVDEKPVMLVFNKVDLIDNPPLLRELSDEYPESIFIAAGRGIRMNRFTERLSEFVERHFSERTIAFVHKDFELANYIHEHGYVLFVHYEDEKAIFRFKMENSKLNKLLNDERVEELPLDYTFPGE